MKRIGVGRNEDNDIVIDDSTVSRYHAELFFRADGSVIFTDLDSTNGSFVNGKRVHGTIQLEYNDIVKVGTSLLPWRRYEGHSGHTNLTHKKDSEAPCQVEGSSRATINNQKNQPAKYLSSLALFFNKLFVGVFQNPKKK